MSEFLDNQKANPTQIPIVDADSKVVNHVATNTQPILLIIYGLPACGKLTTANVLAPMLPGFKLFHNHLVVDTVLSLFPFGSPLFNHFREKLWLDLITAAGKNGDSIIFTYCPEDTVSEGFLDILQQAFENASKEGTLARRHSQQDIDCHDDDSNLTGKVLYVHLKCDLTTSRNRLTNESRKQFRKLVHLDVFDECAAAGGFDVKLPSNPHLVIDVIENSSIQSAEQIYQFVLQFIKQ